jgi:hypothetical protein
MIFCELAVELKVDGVDSLILFWWWYLGCILEPKICFGCYMYIGLSTICTSPNSGSSTICTLSHFAYYIKICFCSSKKKKKLIPHLHFN